jgi:50S ribosomal subunit-associated GTPase HflX
VIDASSPYAAGQAAVVLDELEEIGARSQVLTVLNKIDLIPTADRAKALSDLHTTFPDAVMVSAITKHGFDALANHVRACLPAPIADSTLWQYGS